MSPEDSAELAKKYAGKSGESFTSVLSRPEAPTLKDYDILTAAGEVAAKKEASYGDSANQVVKKLNFRSAHSRIDLDRFSPDHPEAYLGHPIGAETAWQTPDSHTEVARTDTAPKTPDDRIIFERPTPDDPLSPHIVDDKGTYIQLRDELTNQETMRMSTVPGDDDDINNREGTGSPDNSDSGADDAEAPVEVGAGGGTPPPPVVPPTAEGGSTDDDTPKEENLTQEEIDQLLGEEKAKAAGGGTPPPPVVPPTSPEDEDKNERISKMEAEDLAMEVSRFKKKLKEAIDRKFAVSEMAIRTEMQPYENEYNRRLGEITPESFVETVQELVEAKITAESGGVADTEFIELRERQLKNRNDRHNDDPRHQDLIMDYYANELRVARTQASTVSKVPKPTDSTTSVDNLRTQEEERRHQERMALQQRQHDEQIRVQQEAAEEARKLQREILEATKQTSNGQPNTGEMKSLLKHDASIEKDFAGYLRSAVELVESNIGDPKTVEEITTRMEEIANAIIPPLGFDKDKIDKDRYHEEIWLAQARVALHEAQKTVPPNGFADFAEWKKHVQNLINPKNRGFYLRHLLGEAEVEDPVTGEKRTERLPFLLSAIDEVKTYRRTENYDGVDYVLNYYQPPGESSIREDINEQIANEILRPGEDETLRRVPAYYSKLATRLLDGTRRPVDVERKARELFNQNIDNQKEEIKADLFNKGQATPETPEADLNRLVDEALKKRFIKALTVSDGLYRVTGVAARMNGPVYDYQYLKNAWTSFQTDLKLYSADQQQREFKTKHEISEFDDLAALTRTDEGLRKAWNQFMIDKPVVTESGRKASFKDRYCLSPDIDIDQTVNDESLVANRTTVGLVDEKSILPEVMTRQEWKIRHQNIDKLHVEAPPAPLAPPKRSVGQRFSGFFERAMSVQPLTDGSSYYPDLNGYDTDPAPTIDPNKVEVYPSKFDALFTDAKFTYAGVLGILDGAGNESWKQLLYGPVYAEAKDSIKSKQLLPLANFRRQDLFSYVNNMARRKDARGANVDISVNDFDDLYLALTTTAKLGKEIGTKQLNGWLNSVGDSADSLKNFYATGDNPGGILLKPFGEGGADKLLGATYDITEAQRKNSSAGELQKKYIALGKEVEKIVDNFVSTTYKALPGIDVAKGADLLYIMGKMSTYLTSEECERDHRTRLGPESLNYFNRYFFENSIIRNLPLPDSDNGILPVSDSVKTARKIKAYLNKGFMEWHNYETNPQQAFRLTQNTRTSLTTLVSEVGKTLVKIK